MSSYAQWTSFVKRMTAATSCELSAPVTWLSANTVIVHTTLTQNTAMNDRIAFNIFFIINLLKKSGTIRTYFIMCLFKTENVGTGICKTKTPL